MPDVLTCKGLAERYAEAALANYGKDGELAPAVLILNEEQHQTVAVIPVLAPETHGMPGALYAISNLLCPLYDGRYVVAISETWVHTVEQNEEVPDLQRGELEKRALGGDTTVHTGLLVSVFDLEDLPASHALIYNVDQRYERSDMPGLGDGEIGEAMTRVAQMVPEARATRPPGPVPLEAAQFATEVLTGYITALMVEEPISE
jgi:hypothetical protein